MLILGGWLECISVLNNKLIVINLATYGENCRQKVTLMITLSPDKNAFLKP